MGTEFFTSHFPTFKRSQIPSGGILRRRTMSQGNKDHILGNLCGFVIDGVQYRWCSQSMQLHLTDSILRKSSFAFKSLPFLTQAVLKEITEHLKGGISSQQACSRSPSLSLPSLPNAGTLPQAGKFGNRTPDAASIPKQPHVCWVSERAVLCHGTHLSQENWNGSASNTLNDFPTSHLPHLLLSAHFDLFWPLCLQGHQQNCSITVSSSAMEQGQVSLKFSLLKTKKITKKKGRKLARPPSSSVVSCFLHLYTWATSWLQYWALK